MMSLYEGSSCDERDVITTINDVNVTRVTFSSLIVHIEHTKLDYIPLYIHSGGRVKLVII